MRTGTTRKSISVWSFDFDGCLFNKEYREQYKQKKTNAIIDTNTTLFDYIKKQCEKSNPEELVCFIGSNRQDYVIDTINSVGLLITESAVTAIEKITRHLKQILPSTVSVRLDRSLLADDYNNRQDGETFITRLQLDSVKTPNVANTDAEAKAEAKAEAEAEAEAEATKRWIFDGSKFSILYKQIHKLASENPDAAITFNFCDDSLEILNGLQKFFKTNEQYIPKNVTLQLHRYYDQKMNPDKPKGFLPIKGTGEVNPNYKETLKKLMANIAHKMKITKTPQWEISTPQTIMKFCDKNDLKYGINVINEMRSTIVLDTNATMSQAQKEINTRSKTARPTSTSKAKKTRDTPLIEDNDPDYSLDDDDETTENTKIKKQTTHKIDDTAIRKTINNLVTNITTELNRQIKTVAEEDRTADFLQDIINTELERGDKSLIDTPEIMYLLTLHLTVLAKSLTNETEELQELASIQNKLVVDPVTGKLSRQNDSHRQISDDERTRLNIAQTTRAVYESLKSNLFGKIADSEKRMLNDYESLQEFEKDYPAAPENMGNMLLYCINKIRDKKPTDDYKKEYEYASLCIDFTTLDKQLLNKLSEEDSSIINQIIEFNLEFNLLRKATKNHVSDPVRAAGRQVLEKAQNLQSNVERDDLPTLTNCLRETTEAMNNHDHTVTRAYTDAIKAARKIGPSWGKVIAGAMLCVLGATLVAASVATLVVTFGFSTPLSALGVGFGVSLAAAGASGLALYATAGFFTKRSKEARDEINVASAMENVSKAAPPKMKA